MNMNNKFNEMDKLKSNFFYSAYSEAYQDAFLSWIILNYNSDENSVLKDFSKYFIERMLNDFKDNKFTIKLTDEKVELERQKNNSDISVIVKTNDGKHLIILEDKVGSKIHSSNKKGTKNEKYDTQLIKYYYSFFVDDNYVEFFSENKVHLFVYKNQYIDAVESRQIQISNEKYRIVDTIDKIISDKNTAKKEKIKLEERKTLLNKIVNVSWVGIDFIDIFRLFSDYNASSNRNIADNLILCEYYKNHKLYYDEYEHLENSKYTLNIYDNKFKELWRETSWLWEVFFYQLTNEIYGDCNRVNDGNNDGCIYIVPAVSGYYWIWSIHPDKYDTYKDKYSINISARSIIDSIQENKPFSIDINVNNPKYDDEDIWDLKIEDGNIKNISGANKRVEYAWKIQKEVQSNFKEGNYDNETWGKIEKSTNKLKNLTSKLYFELSEYSVKTIANALKTVISFAEEHISTISD
jgi:hypothetical protein